MDPTPVQLQILKTRYPGIGEPALRRNWAALQACSDIRKPDLTTFLVAEALTEAAPKERRLRQSATKLNKLETACHEMLEAQHGAGNVLPQAIRVRLASGAWFKPDFFIRTELTFIECKGPHAFRGGFEFLKVAASIHTWAKFRLVWRVDGQWKFQDVLP